MSSIMFPEKPDIYAGNNSTALFAVEMKEEGGGGERRERRRGGNRKEIKERGANSSRRTKKSCRFRFIIQPPLPNRRRLFTVVESEKAISRSCPPVF